MSIDKQLPLNVAAKIEAEEKYDESHGGPYDRGGADSYYGRIPKPHWWPNGTGKGERIEEQQMSDYQIKAYWAGYQDNEAAGDFKEW